METGTGRLSDKVGEDGSGFRPSAPTLPLFLGEELVGCKERMQAWCVLFPHCRQEASSAPRVPELRLELTDGFITLGPALWAVSMLVGRMSEACAWHLGVRPLI